MARICKSVKLRRGSNVLKFNPLHLLEKALENYQEKKKKMTGCAHSILYEGNILCIHTV